MHTIILDPGHGGVKDGVLQTPGKKWSPPGVTGAFTHDGRFIEGLFNRELSRRVAEGLKELGYNIVWTIGNPDNQNDVPLGARTKVAIDLQKAAKEGDRLLYVSIHANALGDGENWMNGTGWEIYIWKNLQADSRSAKAATSIAAAFIQAADLYKKTSAKASLHLRPTSHLQLYKQENFQVLRDTAEKSIPGILTENGFMDNRGDLAKLQSEQWLYALTQTHVQGIHAYFKAL